MVNSFQRFAKNCIIRKNGSRYEILMPQQAPLLVVVLVMNPHLRWEKLNCALYMCHLNLISIINSLTSQRYTGSFDHTVTRLPHHSYICVELFIVLLLLAIAVVIPFHMALAMLTYLHRNLQ